jgi:Flp pilus assembly protein TadG
MLLKKRPSTKRRGVSLVEFAFVSIILCMLVFGILEYCLFLYTYQIMQNAAREGARYGVVNYNDANQVAEIQAYVQSLMMGLDTKMTNYSCQVYLADANGNNINSSNPVANATTAQFGQNICVQVNLTYTPVTPGLLFLSSSLNLQTKCCMASEAN